MDPILQARGDVNRLPFGCLLAPITMQPWLERGASRPSQNRAGGSSVNKPFGGMDGWPMGHLRVPWPYAVYTPFYPGRPKALLE